MKKIIFIFVMLFSMLTSSQNRLSYSNELHPLILEFVNEGLDRDLNLFGFIVENVDWIVLSNKLPKDQLGVLIREKRVILIKNGMDVMSTRITLFHELGHLLTDAKHTCYVCTDIMSEKALDPYYFYDKEVYKIEMDKFFNYIKKNIK